MLEAREKKILVSDLLWSFEPISYLL